MFIKNKIPSWVKTWHEKTPSKKTSTPVKIFKTITKTKPFYHPPPSVEDPSLIDNEIWKSKGAVIIPEPNRWIGVGPILNHGPAVTINPYNFYNIKPTNFTTPQYINPIALPLPQPQTQPKTSTWEWILGIGALILLALGLKK